MKKYILLMVIVLILTMTGCQNHYNMEYTLQEEKVNGYEVYYADLAEEKSNQYCKTFHQAIIPLDEYSNLTFRYDCMGTGYFLKVENKYYQFDDAIENQFISALDLFLSGYGIIEKLSTPGIMLKIDLNDFELSNVNIHEYKDELSPSDSGEWDTEYNLLVNYEDIQAKIDSLFTTKIKEINHCEERFCILLKAQAPIKITLTSAEYELVIGVYPNFVDFYLRNNEQFAVVYYVEDNKNTAQLLYKYLEELHKLKNK